METAKNPVVPPESTRMLGTAVRAPGAPRVGETRVDKPQEKIPAPARPATAGEAHTALPQLVERLHRRFLDLLRVELSREGVHDIAPVQMLLLLNMSGEELAIQELIDRGNYLRSQTFYNIKKLVEAGYLEQERAKTDRRTVRVRLTKKATALCARLRERQEQLAQLFAKTEDKPDNLEFAYRVLRRLERAWDDYLRFGRI